MFCFQTERGEWQQFQADLQVAVSVADRLRAEAEEELTSVRTAHKDLEREFTVVQQRQKEADLQLITLRGELKESRQSLAKTDTHSPCQEPERPNGNSSHNLDIKEVTRRGRERAVYRLGREETESSVKEVTTNTVSKEARTDCVTKRYLRNVTNEDRSGDDARSSDTRKAVITERSR